MSNIAVNDNIARIRFGVEGGDSIGGTSSGADIKRTLDAIAREISKDANQPKIMFGVANTAEQLQTEFSKLLGTKPIKIDFGFGTPSEKTKQSVKKYTDGVVSQYQQAMRDIQSAMRQASDQHSPEVAFKNLGTTMAEASKELDQLTKRWDKYDKVVQKYGDAVKNIPKLDPKQNAGLAVDAYDQWAEQYADTAIWRPKGKSYALQSVGDFYIDFADKTQTFEEIEVALNGVKRWADEAANRMFDLQDAIESAEQAAPSLSEIFQSLTPEIQGAFNDINTVLSGEGFEPISLEKLMTLSPDDLQAQIAQTIGAVREQVEVAETSGGTSTLKFTADISPEAQEALRVSLHELVSSVTNEAFMIRFVADTSAESLTAFTESLAAFSQLNNGQPVEVAITAGTSQETIDKLAESIREVAEQVEGKEFHVQFAPLEGTIESLRQEVEQGFEEAVGVKLDVRDKEGNSVNAGSIAQSTEAVKKHVEAFQSAVELEKEKTQVANELTTALNAEAAAMEHAEKTKNSHKPKQTSEEKERARQEAQMWAEWEKEKTEVTKVYSQQRAKEAAAAAKERERIEREAADKVAADNRAAYEREEADFDHYARRHTAELKAKAQAEKDAAEAAERAAQERQKAVDNAIKAEQRAERQAEASSLSYDKLTNKVTTYFHKFEDEIKKNPELVAQYEQLLNNLNTQAFGRNMTQAAAAVQKFQLACEQAGIGANSFIKKLITGFSNKLFYGGLAKAAAEIRRLARQVYENTKELDSAMTQLRIVTGATDAQMSQFLDRSTALARELGKSISDVMKSVETFSRLGFNLGDASELAKYATVLSNVAAVDVGTATTGLTSIIKAFGMQVSDSEHVADVLVNVGQKYAISAEELMAAFERGGSALAATGTSFDKATALFAAANASMQNAEKIGRFCPAA